VASGRSVKLSAPLCRSRVRVSSYPRVVLVRWAVPPRGYSGSQWDSTPCNASMIPPSLSIPLVKKKLHGFKKKWTWDRFWSTLILFGCNYTFDHYLKVPL